MMTAAVAGATLAEAGLSFLGIGVKLPTETWGGVIQDGLPVLRTDFWIAIAPGIAISFSILALAVKLLGDRPRGALEPRLRGSAARR